MLSVAAAAAAEVETASQASEPASQASDEEDLAIPDIYFVSRPPSFPFVHKAAVGLALPSFLPLLL